MNNEQPLSAISTTDYKRFQDWLELACGIVLGEGKEYLISSRLSALFKEMSIPSLGDLVNRLNSGDQSLRTHILDAMTTNETLWFRDAYPFDILKHHLFSEFIEKKKSELRIWSAACSSGQEAFSICMTHDEYFKIHTTQQLRLSIVATDISPNIVAISD